MREKELTPQAGQPEGSRATELDTSHAQPEGTDNDWTDLEDDQEVKLSVEHLWRMTKRQESWMGPLWRAIPVLAWRLEVRKDSWHQIWLKVWAGCSVKIPAFGEQYRRPIAGSPCRAEMTPDAELTANEQWAGE